MGFVDVFLPCRASFGYVMDSVDYDMSGSTSLSQVIPRIALMSPRGMT